MYSYKRMSVYGHLAATGVTGVCVTVIFIGNSPKREPADNRSV